MTTITVTEIILITLVLAIWFAVKFIIAVLATLRLSALLTYDYGPWHMFDRLRMRVRAREINEHGRPVTLLGGILSCLWCTSVWIAMLAALLIIIPGGWIFLLVPAISGGVVVLTGGSQLGMED